MEYQYSLKLVHGPDCDYGDMIKDCGAGDYGDREITVTVHLNWPREHDALLNYGNW
jgi:hypothetical protein